jgi:hypothetical protein
MNIYPPKIFVKKYFEKKYEIKKNIQINSQDYHEFECELITYGIEEFIDDCENPLQILKLCYNNFRISNLYGLIDYKSCIPHSPNDELLIPHEIQKFSNNLLDDTIDNQHYYCKVISHSRGSAPERCYCTKECPGHNIFDSN